MFGKRTDRAPRQRREVIHVHLRIGTALAAFCTAALSTGMILCMRHSDQCAAAQVIRETAAQREGERPTDRERHLEERIRSLTEHHESLKAATIKQIATLYRQLVKRALSTFGLSAPEMDIATAIVFGESNADIARALGLTESAVKHRSSAVLKKTGVRSRHDLRMKVRGILDEAAAADTVRAPR